MTKLEHREVEIIEMELVLQAMQSGYGYDFKSYSKASVYRRLNLFREKNNYKNVSSIIPDLLRDQDLLSDLVQYLSIPVSDIFRDPWVFRFLRDEIFPDLRTYPSVKIWSAGCALGEEVYSLSILSGETGLNGKVKIYGTDFNDSSLNAARKGIYNIDRVRNFTRNYQQSGGYEDFSNYYHAGYDSVKMSDVLKKDIVFTNHNLVSDSSFGEMNLILCRNVLIYFDTDLQNRVLQMITDSLVHGGYLCLGTKESLSLSTVKNSYSLLDSDARIYKKRRI